MEIGEENCLPIWKADQMNSLQMWEADDANHRELYGSVI